MAEMKGKKKRLPINLSFLALTDPKKQTSAYKSPRNFEEPNGVVGLGIVAALNNQDLIFNNGSRNAVLLMSPKSASNPIPILSNKNDPPKFSYNKLSVGKMAFCEEYTCVISHVGDNLIKKREYFEADILENNNEPPMVVTVSDSPASGGGDTAAFATPNFLSSCFLCEKMLHGLDVFMYRGIQRFVA